MTTESTPGALGSNAVLGAGAGAWESDRALIVEYGQITKMWLAHTPGVFTGPPAAVWERRLTLAECENLLADPLQLFERRQAPNAELSGHQRPARKDEK